MKKPKIYYAYYGQAIEAVWEYVSEKYIISPDDWFNQLASGGKPRTGFTKRGTVSLYNKETKKELKKALHVQVYRMSAERFELNFYIS